MKLKAILTAILLAFVFVIATPQRASADWSRICYAFSVGDIETGIDHWDEDEPDTFYYAAYITMYNYGVEWGYPNQLPDLETLHTWFMNEWIARFNTFNGGQCN